MGSKEGKRKRREMDISTWAGNGEDMYRPILAALAERYGLDEDDAEGIMERLEEENEMDREAPVERRAFAGANEKPAYDEVDRHTEQVIREAEELRRLIPDFDLRREMRNPRFIFLTAPGMGISVKEAFFAIHGEEIMRYAAARAGNRLAASVRSGAGRPMENGMQAQNPVSMGVDIRNMDKKLREEYRRRIHNGEMINFRDRI